MRLSAYSLALALLLTPFAGRLEAEPAAGNAKAAAKPALKWMSLESALKNAEASKRYLFVSVYTDWCGYCKKLNAVTFKSAPVIAELDKNFESVRLNAESDAIVTWKGKKMTSRALADHWGVEGFPTLLFLNRRGEIVGSFSSYVEPELMVKLLTYISSGARERKVTFDAYLEGKS
ncbi:MAG: Thioredoxin-related protein [Fibrobacteria bacterium]|jgi:thioredoxin-related protein|nr:Thioredoxin-related protein [Fibrobacteria bacterium]